jgi:hypothetical protein
MIDRMTQMKEDDLINYNHQQLEKLNLILILTSQTDLRPLDL